MRITSNVPFAITLIGTLGFLVAIRKAASCISLAVRYRYYEDGRRPLTLSIVFPIVYRFLFLCGLSRGIVRGKMGGFC